MINFWWVESISHSVAYIFVDGHMRVGMECEDLCFTH